MSPRRKKRKTTVNKTIKRRNESVIEGTSTKRSNSVTTNDDRVHTQRRKNFVTACEQVSCKAYLDHRSRLLLIDLPPCLEHNACKPQNNIVAKQIPEHVEGTFMIDSRANMWYEALEVCIICITPTQYLSSMVLKEIVEFMLNAHQDEYANYTIPELLSKCQQVLLQNINIHPPCLTKTVTQTYIDFLTSPLDLKENTFTNRSQFGHNKGVVRYCLNRLEYEISTESQEASLVDKEQCTPKEMQQTLKGLHWQKEKFEIYECLERMDRIERLMSVLEIIAELLQSDLAIWQYRYTNNLETRIMMPIRPLMAHSLWLHNVLYTGAVTKECEQIIKIFAQVVHLRCPEKHIRIITMWLNLVIQMVYICENKSNSNYPNIGKYSLSFAAQFYKIIADMPNDSIIRIIESVQPTFMKYIIGTIHLKKILSTEESCVMKILIDFVKQSKWEEYPEAEDSIDLSIDSFQKYKLIKNKTKYLTNICVEWKTGEVPDDTMKCYPKMGSEMYHDGFVTRNHVVHALYATFQAYLDAYSARDVQETINSLNEKVGHDDTDIIINQTLPELNSYSVTEDFIKKYRSIYEMLKELVILFQQLKNNGELPEALKIFGHVDLLDI